MILSMSIEVRLSMFRVMVHTSYNVDTLYIWFGASWRMLKDGIHNEFETLIALIIAETTKLTIIIHIQHIAYNYR